MLLSRIELAVFEPENLASPNLRRKIFLGQRGFIFIVVFLIFRGCICSEARRNHRNVNAEIGHTV